jgi:hypothetical protein
MSIYSLFVLNGVWKWDSFQIMIFVYVCSTWSIVELVTCFETWITRKDINDVILFHVSYLITLMAYLCSQWKPNDQIKYFVFERSIYRLFVLNGGWKCETLQIMIFVCVLDMKDMWTKNAFRDVNNKKWRNWCQFDSRSLFNSTYGLPVLTMETKCPNHVFYVWKVHLKNICAKCGLEMRFFPNNGIRICLFDVKHSWTSNAFWVVSNKKWLKDVRFFHVSYIITLMGYLFSQWTTNVQINYFMFDWSILRLFVLNRGWKRDSLQIMIFVFVCSTFSIFELKTRFEAWITRNDVNGGSLFTFLI